MKLNPDLAYGTLAAIAVGGCISPLLFPLAGALKTVNLVSSIAAAGILAAGHQSGGWQRARRQYEIIRASEHELFMQRRASYEAVELKRIEQRELIETLALLDELTLPEQKYFLDQLGMPELLPIYLPASQPEPEAIEVPASPVKEEASPFTGTLQWAVDSVVNQSTQPAPEQSDKPVDDYFEEVDLGRAIAEMMVSGDVPLNVLLACPPRTGKTTLLTVTLAWLHKLTQGRAKVRIWNGKENIDHTTGELKDKFLGLVYDPTRYKAIQNPAQGKEFADYYHKLAENMLQSRDAPEVDFLDEFNNIRAMVDSYDKQRGLSAKNATLTQVDVDTGLLTTQGTSRRKFSLMTSHSAYVKHLGIDRSYQDGLYFIVLGRGGALNAIYKALKGGMAVVQDAPTANALLAQLQEWATSPTRDHSKVVALTNLVDGNFGLYFVKRIDIEKVQFTPVQSQPESPDSEPDPYEAWDSEFEDEVGHQPEEDPNWEKAKPSSAKPKQPSQKELLDALAAWIKQLGRLPSDEELRAKAAELAFVKPEALSDDAITGMKWVLSQNYGIEGFQFD